MLWHSCTSIRKWRSVELKIDRTNTKKSGHGQEEASPYKQLPCILRFSSRHVWKELEAYVDIHCPPRLFTHRTWPTRPAHAESEVEPFYLEGEPDVQEPHHSSIRPISQVSGGPRKGHDTTRPITPSWTSCLVSLRPALTREHCHPARLMSLESTSTLLLYPQDCHPCCSVHAHRTRGSDTEIKRPVLQLSRWLFILLERTGTMSYYWKGDPWSSTMMS